MRSAPNLNPEYVIDVNGNKKAVILSIEEYEELIEDLRDLAVVAERREEPVVRHQDVMAELKRNGYYKEYHRI
ncbi:MAG: type II toxin-antitoxin system Phd/YefM family antitoxin [Deltaproteobacteria bacterium]|nr:type II toxin-antitoxin system Phd/YefM family antitoxin [Deltaproteobacteria bacterium]